MKIGRKEADLKKILLYSLPVLIIVLFIIFLKMPKDCGSDIECFNKAAQKCSASTLTLPSQGSLFYYKIYGSSGDNCVVKIQILELDAVPEIKEKFENKYMICNIPKSDITNSVGIGALQKTTEKCTGPLKEAILQSVIEKLYSVITQNIGKITVELEDTLKPVSE